MPEEIRHIEFSNHELRNAVDAYNRILPEKVLHGRIIACGPRGKSVIAVLERAPEGHETETSTMELSEAFVLESLVRFSLDNDIVMPRNSSMALILDEGAVSLEVVLPPVQARRQGTAT